MINEKRKVVLKIKVSIRKVLFFKFHQQTAKRLFVDGILFE